MQRHSIFHRTVRPERRGQRGRPVAVYGESVTPPPPEALRDDGSVDGVRLRTFAEVEAERLAALERIAERVA